MKRKAEDVYAGNQRGQEPFLTNMLTRVNPKNNSYQFSILNSTF